KTSSGMEVGFRSYRDSVGAHPPMTLDIRLAEGRVGSLRDLSSPGGKELFTATVEPERIGDFFTSEHQQRRVVRLKGIPIRLQEAVVQVEDRDFYSHHGFSARGILRAAWRNLRGGQVTEGGSTLTQQLMKNFFLSSDRTLQRKIREFIMTVVAEGLYSKDQILEAYLNEIYLGQRGSTSIHGVAEAARFYFSKNLDQLSLGEDALLAGMVSSPGRYSPYNDLKAAKARRDVVLKILKDRKKITEKEFAAALHEKLQPRGQTRDERVAPYFLDYVQAELKERFSEDALQTEGYEIHTMLDPALQALAEKAAVAGLKELDKKNPGLDLAMVVLQPRTGFIKAMVGGRDYGKSQYNRVTLSRRQIGSLVKPFIAAAALSPPAEGEPPVATAATLLEDKPTTFSFEGKDWSPKNYERKYFGTVTLRRALENSLNVATVNLASMVGVASIGSELRRFGFEVPLSVPSIALGALSAPPIAVARAYTAFVNAGAMVSPQGISAVLDSDGQRLEQRSMEVDQILSPDVAFLVTNLLRGVVERGTARKVPAWGLRRPLAGKTGTTDDNRDSWFVGYSPSLLAAVWVGRDDNVPTGLTGASGALTVWIRFMAEALKRVPQEEFEIPPGIQWFDIVRELGCREGQGEILHEAFLQGTEPAKCK
ncbi:MAG: PBP1A family penicillin-binding protein, partial [Pseudomonadota bacterium]